MRYITPTHSCNVRHAHASRALPSESLRADSKSGTMQGFDTSHIVDRQHETAGGAATYHFMLPSENTLPSNEFTKDTKMSTTAKIVWAMARPHVRLQFGTPLGMRHEPLRACTSKPSPLQDSCTTFHDISSNVNIWDVLLHSTACNWFPVAAEKVSQGAASTERYGWWKK